MPSRAPITFQEAYHTGCGRGVLPGYQWSAIVEVFGCRHAETIPTLRRPASEKRQGTKSREVEHRRGRGRYGDCMLSPHSGMELMSAECGRRICILRPETGDGRLGKCWESINELRVCRGRRLRREGLLPAWGQRV